MYQRECVICQSEVHQYSKCGCNICLDCRISWFEERNRLNETYEITCYCNIIYTRDELLQYCQEQPYQDKIQSILIKEYLKNKDIRPCPNGNCHNYGFIMEQDFCDQPLECDNCHTKWKDYSKATYKWWLIHQMKNFISTLKTFLYFFFQNNNECANCGIKVYCGDYRIFCTCLACLFQYCSQCQAQHKIKKQEYYYFSQCENSNLLYAFLICYQPLSLLNYFDYFGIYRHLSLKLFEVFLCVSIVVFGYLASLYFFLCGIRTFNHNFLRFFKMTGSLGLFYAVYQIQDLVKYFFELSDQVYLNNVMVSLIMFTVVLCCFKKNQKEQWILLLLMSLSFINYGLINGIGLSIWLWSQSSEVRSERMAMVGSCLFFVSQIWLIVLNIFSLWELITTFYPIIILVEAVRDYRVQWYVRKWLKVI